MSEGEPPQPTHRLRIDLTELETAFDNASDDVHHFVDLETGAVVIVTDDVRYEYDQLCGKVGDVAEDEWPAAFEAAMEAEALPDWEREVMRAADRLERYGDERYLRVPHASSNEGYGDMQAFVESLGSGRLANLLWKAIEGRRPFRAFKDVLLDYPGEREQWFAFKRARVHARIREWLAEEGVAVVEGDDQAHAAPDEGTS